MRSSATILGFHLSVAAFTHAAGSVVKSSDCDCYLTNGTQPTFYANHVFFDFRDLARYAGVPPIVDDASAVSPPTSSYFSSPPWTSTWQMQTWNNSKGNRLNGDATVFMVNSPNNIYIEADNGGTYLNMRTSRLDDFQTASEFSAKASDYLYLSMRVLARTTGAAGAVSAIFTYRDAPKLADIQEADMEIVTAGPRDKVQYTNQPSYTDTGDVSNGVRASRNATLPNGKHWTDWNVYRLDWTPERSTWYVDGQEVASIAFQVPRDPASINFNSWGNGGSWAGNMTVGAQASLQIKWIEIIYNATAGGKARRGIDTNGSARSLWDRALQSRAKESQCGAVCSIDESSDTGTISKLWGVKSSDANLVVSRAKILTCVVGFVSLMALWA